MTNFRRGLMIALTGATLTVAGCRDQGPEAVAIPETYLLESIAGQPLPLQLSDPGSAGAFVTIHAGRIKLGADSVDGALQSRQNRLMRLETTAKIVRRGKSGDEVVAEGESSEAYRFDWDDAAIVPYRMERGVRVDAPFWLEVSGRALVMHSDQDVLRNWRFVR